MQLKKIMYSFQTGFVNNSQGQPPHIQEKEKFNSKIKNYISAKNTCYYNNQNSQSTLWCETH